MSVISDSPGRVARNIVVRQSENLLLILVAFWAGALWTTGFIVAPTLFQLLPERALAGSVAGHLFQSVHWIAVVAGGYVLLFALLRHGREAFTKSAVWLAFAMLVIVAIGALGLQPIIAELRLSLADNAEVRERFSMLHGISSMLYALSSVLAVVLLVKVRKLFD
ncbi:MAG TPA: DUF4149 domain-containing protein [Azoarcus sp.]|nr:DUF4149 domain-containing protein [Azoarcus sp.]